MDGTLSSTDKYNKKQDTYTHPQNQTLQSNGRWYHKDRKASSTKVKHYKTEACLSCPVMAQCTKNQKGRLIEQSEYIEANRQRMEANKEVYRRRRLS